MLEQPQLGKKLKSRRKDMRLSLRDLSQASGVSVTTIAELENGRRYNPHLSTLECVLFALDADLGFVEGPGVPNHL